MNSVNNSSNYFKTEEVCHCSKIVDTVFMLRFVVCHGKATRHVESTWHMIVSENY